MNLDVSQCQRCGQDHKQIAFSKLANPADEWDWWGMCPVTNQPILMKIAYRGVIGRLWNKLKERLM